MFDELAQDVERVKKQAIDDAVKSANKKIEQLNQKNNELNQKNGELNQKNNELNQKNGELNQKNNELNQKNDELNQKNNELLVNSIKGFQLAKFSVNKISEILNVPIRVVENIIKTI